MLLESGDGVVAFNTVLLHHRLADLAFLVLPCLLQSFRRFPLHGVEEAVVFVIEGCILLLLVVI